MYIVRIQCIGSLSKGVLISVPPRSIIHGIFNADGSFFYLILQTITENQCRWHVEVSRTVSFSCSTNLIQWTRFHRAMTRPFFTRERISDFEIYDRNADLSLQEAKKRLSEGYSFDVQVIWSARKIILVLFISQTGSRFALYLGLGNRIPLLRQRRFAFSRYPIP